MLFGFSSAFDASGWRSVAARSGPVWSWRDRVLLDQACRIGLRSRSVICYLPHFRWCVVVSWGARKLETYDALMLALLAGTAILGAIKGFAWQVASIASIVLSYWVAYHFRGPLSEAIQAEPPWNRFLAMLILFVGTSLVIWVAFRMVSKTIDRLKLKEFDRQIGALFGLAKGGLYCILVTLFGVTLFGDRVREKIVVSRSGHYISSVLDRSEAIIPAEIHEIIGPYLERFDERLHGGEPSSDENAAWSRVATELPGGGSVTQPFWSSR